MGKSIQYMLGGAAAVIIIAGLKLGADLVNPILFALLLAICFAPLPEWLGRKGLSQRLVFGDIHCLNYKFGCSDYIFACKFCFRIVRQSARL